MTNQQIKDLSIMINNEINYVDKQTIKIKGKVHGKTPLSFGDSIYHLSTYNYTKHSHSRTAKSLRDEKIIDFTKTALLKKRTRINYNYFNNLNNKLLKMSYSKYPKPRILAGDGSTFCVPKELNKEEFKLINDEYCEKKASFFQPARACA